MSDSGPPAPARRLESDAAADLAAAFVAARDRLHRIARAVLGSDDEAQDAVSDALLRALRGIGTLAGRDTMTGWLSSITHRAALDRLNARRRESDLPAEAARPAFHDDSHTDTLHRDGEVDAAVESLPPRQREIVRLRHDGGLRLREIAALLDISMGTASAQLARAYRSLRRRLGASKAEGTPHEPA